MKADYHYFYTAESVAANTTTRGTATGAGNTDSNFLGNELDITAVNKWNANTKVMIGYSNYNASSSFRLLKAASVGAGDANWAYVQFDVKF